MKKVIALLALLCCMVCTACPVFAEDAPSGVGRDDVLAGTFSTAETAQAGDDLASATTDSADALTNLMNGVKEKWEEIFGGLNGVLEFFTVCIAGSFGCLPTGYTIYVIMLCVCISVVAIIKALTSK